MAVMPVGSKGVLAMRRTQGDKLEGALSDYSKNTITFALVRPRLPSLHVVCFALEQKQRHCCPARFAPAHTAGCLQQQNKPTFIRLPSPCILAGLCITVARSCTPAALAPQHGHCRNAARASARDTPQRRALTLTASATHVQASSVSEEILKTEFDSVRLLYNSFKSAISFKPTICTVLSPETLEKSDAIADKFDEYELEGPDRSELLQDLAEFQLASMMYYAMNEACTSEHASRMQARLFSPSRLDAALCACVILGAALPFACAKSMVGGCVCACGLAWGRRQCA